MVLSPDALGIRKELTPFFCCECGFRIGWYEELEDAPSYCYCEECARRAKEDDE